MNYKLRSVKLWAGVLLFVLGTVFAFLMDGSFKEWSRFAQWLFGLYVVGNVASKRGKPVNINVKTDPSVPPEDENAFVIEEIPDPKRCH